MYYVQCEHHARGADIGVWRLLAKVLLLRHRVVSGALAQAPQLLHSEAPAVARPSAAEGVAAVLHHLGARPRPVFRPRANRQQAGDADVAAADEHPGTRPLLVRLRRRTVRLFCGVCFVRVWHIEHRHAPTLVLSRITLQHRAGTRKSHHVVRGLSRSWRCLIQTRLAAVVLTSPPP